MSLAPAADHEFLTTNEAAAIAGAEVRFVNRLFDEDILPEELVRNEPVRRIRSGACVFVRFYSRTENMLTAQERKTVIRHFYSIQSRKPQAWRIGDWRLNKPKWVYRPDNIMTLDFEDLIDETLAEHEKLALARSMIVEDPAILGGEPVLKGTRIPVYDIAASANAGLSVPDILEDYPSLDARKVELAILFAKANPRRGRPKSSPKGSMTSRKVYHRRKR